MKKIDLSSPDLYFNRELSWPKNSIVEYWHRLKMESCLLLRG